MKEINLILAVAAAVVALGTAAKADAIYGTGTIVAQVAQQTPPASDSGVTPPSTTLAQAVRSAEERTNGRAGKVELERKDGVYIYEVKTISKDGTADVFVDFATGNVDRVRSRGFLARISDAIDSEDRREDEALLKALEASSITLSEAIETAESETGGKAVKAKMKDRYGSVFFEVALIVDGSKQRVEVDTVAGKVVAVGEPKVRGGDDDDDDDDHDDDDDDD